MNDNVSMVMSLTGCSEIEATTALEKTGNDTVDAVEFIFDLHKAIPPPPPRKKRALDPIQEHLADMRVILEKMDRDREATSASRHGYEGQVELKTRHEETAQQNNCSPQCQTPSQE